MQATAGWALLSNGMGGIDWAGLPYAVALLGVDDVAAFIHGVQVCRQHRPEQPQE